MDLDLLAAQGGERGLHAPARLLPRAGYQQPPHERVHAHREHGPDEGTGAGVSGRVPEVTNQTPRGQRRDQLLPHTPKHVERRAAERVAGVELPLAAAAAARPRLFPPDERPGDGEVVGAAPGFVGKSPPGRPAPLSAPVHGHDERGPVRGCARHRQHGIEDSE